MTQAPFFDGLIHAGAVFRARSPLGSAVRAFPPVVRLVFAQRSTLSQAPFRFGRALRPLWASTIFCSEGLLQVR